MPDPTPARSRDEVRARFPALRPGGDTVYLDNAGGAQLPQDVIDRTVAYMQGCYAQLGGSYPASRRAAATVDAARRFLRTFVDGDDDGDLILGASTSSLCLALADAHARVPKHDRRRGRRDRVLVCSDGHEANVGPWLRLGERGFETVEIGLRRAGEDPRATDLAIDLDALRAALDERTRLVVVHHVSNLLGRIEDIRAVCELAHAAGAEVVADGVAFAPHRAPDVVELGVDWYVFSAYKVFGPHLAAAYGTHAAFEGLRGANHFFVPDEPGPATFELGGVDHEACAGVLGTRDYLAWLAGDDRPGREDLDRAAVQAASATMRALERPLLEQYGTWLARHDDRLRTIGPRAHDDTTRMPTFSFVVADRDGERRHSSERLATDANARGLGVRYGHFYSHRLATGDLGLEPSDGVVRASLVHYNDPDEVRRWTDFVEEALEL